MLVRVAVLGAEDVPAAAGEPGEPNLLPTRVAAVLVLLWWSAGGPRCHHSSLLTGLGLARLAHHVNGLGLRHGQGRGPRRRGGGRGQSVADRGGDALDLRLGGGLGVRVVGLPEARRAHVEVGGVPEELVALDAELRLRGLHRLLLVAGVVRHRAGLLSRTVVVGQLPRFPRGFVRSRVSSVVHPGGLASCLAVPRTGERSGFA
mmetsp:Transcript_4065/g.14233  ORF Transcript_4065/g.14233 Transcript_4065/m.14233 type:complete len:204 (-) Transcript_4065:121-732(-)